MIPKIVMKCPKKRVLVSLMFVVAITFLHLVAISHAQQPHVNIYITTDSEFEEFPGSGTPDDPYIIEGYEILTLNEYGIYISGTTKHFVIRNCFISADRIGIHITDTAAGTVKIINNTCRSSVPNYMRSGIYVTNTEYSVITNNTCIEGHYAGMELHHVDNSTVANNTITYCVNTGLFITGSDNLTIANNVIETTQWGDGMLSYGLEQCKIINNTIRNNKYTIGAYIRGDHLIIANNTVTNNGGGMGVGSGYNVTIANNTFTFNPGTGLSIDDCERTVVANNSFIRNGRGMSLHWGEISCICYNLFENNRGYGLMMFSYAENTIHHNIFINNNLEGEEMGGGFSSWGELGFAQAWDDGGIYSENIWYDPCTGEGNYWSDLDGEEYLIDDGQRETSVGWDSENNIPILPPQKSDKYPLSELPRAGACELYGGLCFNRWGAVLGQSVGIVSIAIALLPIIIIVPIIWFCGKYPQLCPDGFPRFSWKYRTAIILIGSFAMLISSIWINFFPLDNIQLFVLDGFIYGAGMVFAYLGLIRFKRVIFNLFGFRRKH